MWTRRQWLMGGGWLGLVGLIGVQASEGRTHIVERGDTFYGLARKYGITVAELQAANPGIDPNRLSIGQVLKLPGASPAPPNPASSPLSSSGSGGTASVPSSSPPEFYVVQRGDTLSGIARRYGLSVNELRRMNHLKSDVIIVGQRLRVSGPVPPPRRFVVGAAKRAIDRPRIKPSRWRYIVIHHSGTSVGNARIFDFAHRQRGMENGLAYHFVIGNGTDSRDGEIEVGPRWTGQLAGGHVRSSDLNDVSIGICLVGNFEAQRPSTSALLALRELVDYLYEIIPGWRPSFVLHRDINPTPTVCPGRLFPARTFYSLYRRRENGAGSS